jgi:hypothetical protein
MKRHFIKLFLLLTFSIINVKAFAISPVNQLRAVIVTPFSYENDRNIADNIEKEIDVETLIPQLFFEYTNKLNSFKSLSLETDPKKDEYDIYIKGKVLDVKGGNGAARYFSFGASGRALLVVELQVFDSKDTLLYEGFAVQNGGAGGGLFSIFSNKKNIHKAIKVISKKLYPVAIAGDLTKAEGIIRAIDSEDLYTIRHAAIASIKHEVYKDEITTDAFMPLIEASINSEENSSIYLDTVSWCLKVLGESKNIKYKPLITSLLDNKPHRKIKGYAKKALKKINKANKA